MRTTTIHRLLAPTLGLTMLFGGASGVAAQEPVDVASAVEATVSSGSLGVDLLFSLSGTSADGPQTLEMRGTGAAELGAQRRMRLALDLADYGVGAMELLLVEPLLYVRGDAWADQLDGASWLALDLTSDEAIVDEFKALVSGENDSSLALYWLMGATGPAVPLKQEDVRGTLTQRYVLQLDLQQALPEVPDTVRPVLEGNIAEFRARDIEPLFAADAWVGDDGLIHRVHYEFLDTPPGVTGMSVTYDFSAFGEPVDITPPDADDVRWLTEEPTPSA